jgi:hypothetical protein
MPGAGLSRIDSCPILDSPYKMPVAVKVKRWRGDMQAGELKVEVDCSQAESEADVLPEEQASKCPKYLETGLGVFSIAAGLFSPGVRAALGVAAAYCGAANSR